MLALLTASSRMSRGERQLKAKTMKGRTGQNERKGTKRVWQIVQTNITVQIMIDFSQKVWDIRLSGEVYVKWP